MENPFKTDYSDHRDLELISMVNDGDKEALQALVTRHQLFVYNLALKMTKCVEDAEDLTQEVFIKAITSLSTFRGNSKFRTWLYRITVNHFLNAKKSEAELSIYDFDSYFNLIDSVPDESLSETEEAELKESIEELRINCTAGMLLCLDREQRLVYILGEMFEIDHNLGAEIFGITPGNFRIRLMRARKDLYNWLNRRCGLVNHSNPCRCVKKTKGFIRAGHVNPEKLQFNKGYRKRILELSREKAVPITDTIEDLNKNVFQQHPFQEPDSMNQLLEELLNNQLIRQVLEL